MKYFDIHVTYGEKDGEGYSIFVIAENEDEAIKKAKDNNMFAFEYDYEDIDYIEEIDKEEYDETIGVIRE